MHACLPDPHIGTREPEQTLHTRLYALLRRNVNKKDIFVYV